MEVPLWMFQMQHFYLHDYYQIKWVVIRVHVVINTPLSALQESELKATGRTEHI